MATEISKKEILSLLLGRVSEKYPDLAKEMEYAVNEGKDIEETTKVIDEKTRKKKVHKFRKIIPLTDEEALERAITFLETRLIELPMIINAAYSEFNQPFFDVSANYPRQGFMLGNLIEISIELGGAGDVVRADENALITLEQVPESHISSAKALIQHMRQMCEIGDTK